MLCDCRTHEHTMECWDGKPLRSNLICSVKIDFCPLHAAAKELLDYLKWRQKFFHDNIPSPCGYCGTPLACCGGECVDAYYMGEDYRDVERLIQKAEGGKK